MVEKNRTNETILQQRLPAMAKVHCFDQLESTNDFGKSLAGETEQIPALIYARSQTRGRGRAGKSWISSSGSLTFSFVVDESPELELARFSLTWGCAIATALNELCGEESLFQVKWPNDIYALEKKCSGVLIESIASRPNRFVIGIGINVCQQDLGEQSFQSISVEEASGKELSRIDIIASIWNHFQRMREQPLSVWMENYSKIDVLRSTHLAIKQGEQTVRGQYMGLAENCSIRINVDGKIREFGSGTICEISKLK